MRDGYRPFLPTVARTEEDRRELVVLVSAHWMPGGARRRTNLPVVIDHPPVWPPVRRTMRGRGLLLGGLVAIPTIAAAWFGWHAVSAGKAPHRSQVAAPPAIEVDLPEPPPLGAKAAAPTPLAPRKAAAPLVKAAKADRGTSERSPKLLSIPNLPEVQTAVRGAFASGVAVPWAANGLQGYAVAGPILVDDGHACRNIAIWAKSAGGKGATIGARKCIAEGGAWVDVEQSLQSLDVPEPGQDTPN